MGTRLPTFLGLSLAAFLASPALAQIDSLPKVHARLIAESDSVVPGGKVTVALEQDIREGWHTYWINAGDVGAPTDVQWSLPAGWRAGPIAWPYPKRLPVGPFMDYGYEAKSWLLMDVTAPKDARPGDIVGLKAAASWLVCKEVCVPEDATLSLPLRIVDSLPSPSPLHPAFVAARARIPVASPWPMRFRLADGDLDLFVAAPALARARPVDVEFFPLAAGQIKGSAPQTLGFARDGLVLRLSPGGKKFNAAARLSGVLVLTSSDGSVQALNVAADRGLVPATEFAAEGGMTFLLALFFAFLGGLILNLMPCVLPVLAMKALAIASHGGSDRGKARREGLAYALGAMVSFIAFGMAVVVLRAGGADIGWGFQLQEPIVVAGFALLMFAIGLNLSGVYEFSVISAGDTLTRRGGALGSFFTGVLGVAVAAPCTAPFMAAALGFALTQTASVAIGVFAALGVGFAAPFIVLGLSPSFQRLLPRPGTWMQTLRQIFAFPMYGAAVWLVWVLAQQTNALGIGAALAAMVVLAFALWLWSATRTYRARGRAIGGLAAFVAFVAALACLTVIPQSAASNQSAIRVQSSFIPSERYTAERLAQLRRQGRAVFVDATASWCITCLVNEETALYRPSVRDAFAEKHVAFLVADWTRRDPEVSALLDANGRSGVPLYLYYGPGAVEPTVLPQILTPQEIVNTVRNAR